MENTITIQRGEHGRYVYVHGMTPLFSVGDVLAIYEFYDDYEGEMVLGKVRETVERIDWLNAHHFDYRGLIEKGLALEATEDMYKL